MSTSFAIWLPYKSRPTLSAIGAKTLQPLFEWTEISSGRSLSCSVYIVCCGYFLSVCVCLFFSVTFVIYNYSWAIVIIDWLESCAQHTVTWVSSTHTRTHTLGIAYYTCMYIVHILYACVCTKYRSDNAWLHRVGSEWVWPEIRFVQRAEFK